MTIADQVPKPSQELARIELRPIGEVSTAELEQHLSNEGLLKLICKKTGDDYPRRRSRIKRELARRKKEERTERRERLEVYAALAIRALKNDGNHRPLSQRAARDDLSSEDTRRLIEGNGFQWINAPSPEPSNIRRSKALYFIPGDLRPVYRWRLEFLQTMDVVAPKIWEELQERAQPILARLRLLAAQEPKPSAPLRRANLENQLRGIVLEWSTKHNLGETWAPALAWQRLSRSAQAWVEGPVTSQPTLDLPMPQWDPSSETEADFLKRAKAQLSAVGAKAFYPANPRDLHRLVCWQVLRESPATIAKSEVRKWKPARKHKLRQSGLSLRSVEREIRRAVQELAERLGLPDRPVSKPGRPRKTPGGQQAP
jgi:hypothetical protein